MKLYVIQSKNGIMINIGLNVNNNMIGILCEKDSMWNPSSCDCECNKACKIDKNLDIKNLSCKKRLIGKLVLECKEYTLNTTKTSPDDESGTCEKSNCPIHLILLLLII